MNTSSAGSNHVLLPASSMLDEEGVMAMLVHSLDEPVLRVSLQGLVCSWNVGAERTFGYTSDEAVGKAVSLLLAPERNADVDRWWRAVAQGVGVQRHEVAGLRKNGVRVDLEVTVSPLNDPRRSSGRGEPGRA